MQKIFTTWLAVLCISTSLLVITGCQHKASEENEMFEDENGEDRYEEAEARLKFELDKIKDPATGRVPWDKLWPAIEATQQDRQRNANRTATLNWIERGPNSDVTGPSNGNTRPNAGITSGRVRATMVDSLDPTHKTVFIGSVGGGLWKTTDITTAPANWTLVNDFLSNLAVSDLAQDPRPGFQNNMYFATGESYGNADAVQGVGVFKSTDGGATWNFLPSTSTYVTGTRIVCDAAGNVYLGTRNGLYRSNDGGTTWLDITPTGVGVRICDLEISSTGRLHMCTGIFTTSFYRYTDNPATVTAGTWTTAATPFTSFSNRTELGVSGNTLYACPADASYQVPTIWKSVDGGATWAATTAQPTSGWASGQGWYAISVGIDPSDPNTCIVGGLDCYKTTNGGSSWAKISTWVGTTGQFVHADQHDIQWWDGGTKLLFACDGGIHYSSDRGTTIRDRNAGLRIKQFYSVAMHPTTTNYFMAGAQDNGTHQLTNPGLGASVEVTGGDGAFVDIDQDEPLFQFGAYVYNNYRRSTNGGASWSQVNFSNSGQFINPFDYDDVGNKMYCGFTGGTYLRWNDPQTGNSNTSISVSAFGGGAVTAVQVSPYTPNRVYFGTSNSRFVKVDNADAVSPATITETNITPSGATGSASCMAVGSSDNMLMAVYSNYNINNVWLSTNGGTSWTQVDGNLPNMPVRWALFHPDDDTKAYIATETGVWETDLLNGASTVWVSNPTFPAVRTDMIRYRPSDRTMAAGTHGRGVWSTVIPTAGGFSFDSPGPVTATCPAPATMSTTLTATYAGTFNAPIVLTATGNPAGTTVVFGTNPLTTATPSTTVTLTNTNTLAAGSYTINVTGTATGTSSQTRAITFTINPGSGPAITLQPSNQSICAGGNTSFTVTSATATSFAWQVSTDGGVTWNPVTNGGVYSGATTNTLSLTGVPAAFNNNRYRAVASALCGSTTSSAATLTVNTAASITGQPADATLCAGATASFTVTAAGSGLTYQWELSTDGGTVYTPIANGGVYSGATTATLTVTGVTAGMNNYKYRAVVTGTGACPAPVTSSPATLTVVTSVTITGQPANSTVCAGSNTSFTVSGSGSGIIYQWQVSTDAGASWTNVTNGGVYSGATTNTLTITGATAAMSNYRYRAQLSNSTCTTPGVSNAAILTVNTAPAITSQPVNSTICAAGNTSFTVAANGTGLAYQWQVSTDGGVTFTNLTNGGAYSGVNTTTLNITGAAAGLNNNRYRAVVSGTCAPAVNSNAATLTVVSPVTVTTQPANQEVCSGSNATFSVTGNSSETIIYQWQVSTDGGSTWTNVSGANAATYTVNGALVVMNSNRYRVLLSSSSCGTATVSNSAVLTVRALPSVTLSAAPLTTLLPGQTTTLTATPSASTGGVLVTSWLFNGNAAAITGNTYVVDISKVGAYQVRNTETWPSGLFCSALSQVVTITAQASTRLFIYPSPNNGQFTVAYYNSNGASDSRIITIFDSKGSMVYSRKFAITGSYTLLPIDMRQDNRGIYYVVVGDANGNKLADGKVHIR